MGSEPTLVRNFVDTFVGTTSPNKNYNSGTYSDRLFVMNGTTDKRYSYLYFGLPFPRGVQILSAKLRLTQFYTQVGSTVVSVDRATSSWSASKITWNNRPSGTAPTAPTATITAGAGGRTWEWDVTALLQSVSNGASWYGFRVFTNTTNGSSSFYTSSSSKIAYQPVLEITWKDNPLAPTVLRPSDDRAISLAKPTLQFDFTDLSGDVTMASCQVRIFASQANADANASAEFDSGEVLTSVPELDLSTTAYAGIADNTQRWWRVRVKDGAGLWSAWSDPESFYRQSKGTLTLNNPAASPNNVVSDSTPPIDWTFTGRTQTAFEVIVRPDPVRGVLLSPIKSSGKTTSTATVYTLPEKFLPFNDRGYTIIVRVWDNVSRENSPNDPPYVEVSRYVTFSYDSTVAPVGSISVTQDTGYPWAIINFSRSAQPDQWNIYRDNKIISNAFGSDLFVSGTSYRFIDRLADPRVPHTWKAVPIVNGKGAASSPGASMTIKPRTVTLSEQDGSNPILIWNYKHDLENVQVDNVFTPAGDGPPVLRRQANHGYQGSVAGFLYDNPVSSVTAADAEQRLEDMKAKSGSTLLLCLIDRYIECFINNVSITPHIDGEGVFYEVSFDFYQSSWDPQ